MPEYLAPGVYVEEIEIGAKPIEGVSTSTAGFLGKTERGPIKPKLITGFEQYKRIFGDYIEDSYLSYAVYGFFINGGKRCFVGRIIAPDAIESKIYLGGNPGSSKKKDKGSKKKEGDQTQDTTTTDSSPVNIKALGPGAWGENIAVKIENSVLSNIKPDLFKLTVCYWKDEKPVNVDLKTQKPTVMEVYENLSIDKGSSDYYAKKVNNISNLIEFEGELTETPKPNEFTYLSGGSDGKSIQLSDYDGSTELGKKSGLAAFEEIDEISIVCAPDEVNLDGLSQKVVDHCENMKDRFAILQAKQSSTAEGLMPPNDSKYAAFYYPWIKIIDPVTNIDKLVPPGGHIAGIYARSDQERGVHKAPANEVIRGTSGLEFDVTKGTQDLLNPKGVNCIRTFRSRGIRVWGARTTSSDSLWKYVNVRRLFLFLEESIDEGTQWVVFEPNDEKLWARVKQTITQFLTQVWKDGALMGNTPEEAFFVKCDRTTMTQNDIDNGRLIVMIGVSPVKPAEFVIFRIAQWTAGAKT